MFHDSGVKRGNGAPPLASPQRVEASIMGDKSPKADKKQSSQKQTKTDASDAKKKSELAAKPVDKTKNRHKGASKRGAFWFGRTTERA